MSGMNLYLPDGLKTVKFGYQTDLNKKRHWGSTKMRCKQSNLQSNKSKHQLTTTETPGNTKLVCHVWSAVLHGPNRRRPIQWKIFTTSLIYKTYILHCRHSNPGPQRRAKGAAQSTNCTSWAYIQRWMCRIATAILSSILAFGASRHSDTCGTALSRPQSKIKLKIVWKGIPACICKKYRPTWTTLDFQSCVLSTGCYMKRNHTINSFLMHLAPHLYRALKLCCACQNHGLLSHSTNSRRISRNKTTSFSVHATFVSWSLLPLWLGSVWVINGATKNQRKIWKHGNEEQYFVNDGVQEKCNIKPYVSWFPCCTLMMTFHHVGMWRTWLLGVCPLQT